MKEKEQQKLIMAVLNGEDYEDTIHDLTQNGSSTFVRSAEVVKVCQTYVTPSCKKLNKVSLGESHFNGRIGKLLYFRL